MSASGCWFEEYLHLNTYSRLVFGYAGNARARGLDTTRLAPHGSGARDGGALFVGRQPPHKGVGGLVRGLPPDIRLVGPRPDGGTAQLAALARGKNVTCRDDLNDHALVEAYGRALWIVLSSVSRTTVSDHLRQACAMDEAGRRHIFSHFTWPAVVSRRLTAHPANTIEREA